jgi:glutamine synthetase type III
MENVESRNTLIKTLSETTEVKTAIQLPMETLLNIANREISSYIENLDEDSKRDLSKVLMTEDTELSKEFEELKTKTIHSLSNLNESMDESTTKKLQETIQQIKGEVFSKINYVKLYNLYNNIN